MKILYDENIFLTQKVGGISRYHYELYKGMLANGIEADITGKFIKNNYLLEDLNFRKKFIADPFALFPYFNKLTTIRKVKDVAKYDVLHLTGYYDYLKSAIPKEAKVVITIHDMIPEKELATSNPLKHFFAVRANKIIAVSEKTKKDIVEIFGIAEDKIHVVYHGSSLSLDQAKQPAKALPESYILFVGQRNGYKNFTSLINGIVPVLNQNKSLHLVCAGRRAFNEKEQSQFKKLGIENQLVSFNNIDDDNLAFLYQHAQAFVFPSLFEGFGIPILEAWSCKTPVLLSDIDCFREIAGEAGYYFDPQNPQDITIKINEVLADSQLANDLRMKGTERLKTYSWHRAVDETIKIYNSLL
jgi:glycosyltransferase involved in cell wall biosynthesis